MSCKPFGAKFCNCPKVDVFPAIQAGVEIPDASLTRIVTNNQNCVVRGGCGARVSSGKPGRIAIPVNSKAPTCGSAGTATLPTGCNRNTAFEFRNNPFTTGR